jgi:hypothetical protein
MNLPDAPIAHEGSFATHFFTVRDQEKSKDFCVRILGGKLIKPENPCYIKLANTWLILNSSGGPTPDKPEVLLETPSDLNRVCGCTKSLQFIESVSGTLRRSRTGFSRTARTKIQPIPSSNCSKPTLLL